ncbi:MAG: hypothetical protein D6785_09050, partial [Planctomycetota bacterium]
MTKNNSQPSFFSFKKSLLFFLCFFFLLVPPLKAQMTGVLKRQINKAITNSTRYLYLLLSHSGIQKKIYRPPNAKYFAKFPQGVLALHLYALIHGGISPRDPLIAKGIQTMIALPMRRTYSVSTSILAIYTALQAYEKELLEEKKKKKKIKNTEKKPKGKKKLVDGSYLYKPEVKAFVEKGVQWLLLRSIHDGEGGWNYGDSSLSRTKSFQIGDHSNTQFAAFALWTAKEMGIPVGKKYWKQILRCYMDSSTFYFNMKAFKIKWPPLSLPSHPFYDRLKGKKQRTYTLPRVWIYTTSRQMGVPIKRYPQSLAIVFAGVTGILISADALGKLHDPKVLQFAGEGLVGASGVIHAIPVLLRDRKVKTKGYYLYSLEKMGAFTGQEFLGGRWWYPHYAQQVVNLQTKFGNFSSYLEEDCLILLFLSRSTLKMIQWPRPKWRKPKIITPSPSPSPKSSHKPKRIITASRPKQHSSPRKPSSQTALATGKKTSSRPPKKKNTNPIGAKAIAKVSPQGSAQTPIKTKPSDPFKRPNETVFQNMETTLILLAQGRPVSFERLYLLDQKFSTLKEEKKLALLPSLVLAFWKNSKNPLLHSLLKQIFLKDYGKDPMVWYEKLGNLYKIQKKEYTLPKLREIVLQEEGLLFQKALQQLSESQEPSHILFLLQILAQKKKKNKEEKWILQGLFRLFSSYVEKKKLQDIPSLPPKKQIFRYVQLW